MNYLASAFAKVLWLFTTPSGRALKAATIDAIIQVVQEAMAHPEWTADDRRKRAFEIVKARIAASYPQSSSMINWAIEFLYQLYQKHA